MQICGLVLCVAALWVHLHALPRLRLLVESLVRRRRCLRMWMVVWGARHLRSELFALRIPSLVLPFRSGCA